jgi:hypothetical protein
MRRGGKWALIAVVLLALVAALSSPDSKQAQPAAMTTPATPSPTSTPTLRSTPSPARAKATPAPAATPVAFASCDVNIRARAATTTCPFAQNVFYEYYQETLGYPASVTVQAWSPRADRFFSVHCAAGSSIVCRAGDGAEIKFSGASVAAYDDEQASRFASTHDVSGGDSAGTPATGVGQNIPNYENGTGYRVQCADGMFSRSGGRPGACSGHGGVGFDPTTYGSSDTGNSTPDFESGQDIPNYENGTGSRVQCADGMYSQSGGRPGACSGHGGVG